MDPGETKEKQRRNKGVTTERNKGKRNKGVTTDYLD